MKFRTKATASAAGHARPGASAPTSSQRFDQDELRHLLATAGGMAWGITSARLPVIETGQVPAGGCPAA